ncbi:hypothetical protein D3C71_617050 [compost metagenome]
MQAVKQVLAKRAGGHAARQTMLARAQDAHVDGFVATAAQLAHAALLQHAQQLYLHGQRQIVDFIEQQTAAMSRLEQALALVQRARIGARAAAEEFRFHQRFGNSAAVDGDKREAGTRALRMDGTRRQFLARARFAADGHRRATAGDAADLRAQRLHGQRVAAQLRRRRHIGGRMLAGTGTGHGERAFPLWRRRTASCRCYAGRRPEDVTIRMSNGAPACPYKVACAWLQ